MARKKPPLPCPHPRPTREQLQAALGKYVPDVIAPGLKVLFCGINPGLYSAAVGHHFARPGNRFWPALFQAGFTDRLLTPYEEQELLPLGFGVTNLVRRATAAASDLAAEELVAGRRRLVAKVRRFRPRILAVLGIDAYRRGFDQPRAQVGSQTLTIGSTGIWVLPNPSGLNANYQLAELVKQFQTLRGAAER